MVRIVEKQLNIEFPRGHHLHAMVCQIPNRLELSDFAYQAGQSQEKWRQVRSILDLVAEAPGNLKRLHFLFLPESDAAGRPGGGGPGHHPRRGSAPTP